MKVQRVEKHVLKQNNKYYDMVDEFCYLSKNLYNHANYIVRNEFVKNDKWIRYNDLDNPKAFADGIKGVALHPIRVNIA